MLAMEDRVRITYDLSELAKRALYINAARRDMSIGEVMEQLIRTNLVEDVAFAERSIAEGQPATRPRRGRKPRG